jgi:hypothetical protein
MVSSLPGDWVSIVSTPSEVIETVPLDKLSSTPSDGFISPPEWVPREFITGQPVAKPSRSTYGMVFG